MKKIQLSTLLVSCLAITSMVGQHVYAAETNAAAAENSNVGAAANAPAKNTPGKADSTDKTDNPAPLLSSEAKDVNYSGDYIQFHVDTVAQKLKSDGKENVAVPAGSCFRVDNDPNPDNPRDETVTGKFVTKTSEDPFWFSFAKQYALSGCKGDKVAGDNIQYPSLTTQYKIKKTDLLTYDRDRYGWTYGVLAAPFKYYPGQGQFGTNISIDGYVGYRLHDRQGSETILAFGLGPTSATVKTANGESNITGASVAIALLTEIKHSFNIGVLIGSDYFSKADANPLSGKAYIGFNLGAKIN